jgi:hypothetical protein
MRDLKLPEIPPELTKYWQKYARQYKTGAEYSPDSLVHFVIGAWRLGYVLDQTDVQSLVESSEIRWENEDRIADEVDAIVSTLRILSEDYQIEGLSDDRT